MKRAALVLSLVLCGCVGDDSSGQNGGLGPGSPEEPKDPEAPPGPGMMFGKTNVGGSRLKAKVLVGPDGSKNYPGMYDSMLKVDCAYEWAEDRKLRCLPTNQRVQPYPDWADVFGGTTPHYADADCRGGQVAVSLKALPPMAFLGGRFDTRLLSDLKPDTLLRKWYRLTEFTAQTYFYGGKPGDCRPAHAVTLEDVATYRFYTYDPSKPALPTDFVQVADMKLE